MAGWLTRAAAAFSRRAEAPPEPFDVPCDCGGRLTGVRVAGHQKLRCLGCERYVLVLPASPYPAVKRRLLDVAPKPPRSIVHASDRQESSQAGPRRTSRPAKKKRSPPEPDKARTVPQGEEASPTPEPLVLSPQVVQTKSRRLTIRLIVVSIAALLGVTGWSLRNRALREDARALVPVASEAGLTALRQGDFPTAVRELSRAVQGLDTLRRGDAAATAIRQAYREAVAANGLATASLSQLAEEFLTDTGTPEERLRRFQTQSGSKWLIFDANVVQTSFDGTPLYQLEVPWMVGERPLQVQLEFPEMDRMAADRPLSSAARIIFAGQIDDWIVPERPRQPIVARLRKTTAFLWTDYDSLRAVGFQPESKDAERETRELLNRQREIALSQ